MPLDIEELEPTTRNDYRRANGAPMVMVDGKNERYSRPSSFAKPLDDESALVNWKIDRACMGVAGDRALQAQWVAVTDEDRQAKSDLREKAIAAGRGAERADIGTALHAMSVRFETDLAFSPPQPYLESLQAYINEMTRLNLRTVFSEFHTVNREYRCAGTADRLYETGSPLVTPTGEILPVGTLIIGDLKTGEKLEYSKPAYAVQLALYADGELYNVLTDEFEPTPPINRQWAIVVHMPAEFPGTCEFLWVDLEVGRHGAYIVQMVKTWRKMWRSGEFDMPPLELDTNLVTSFETAPCWCGDPLDTAVTHQQGAPCFALVSVADGLQRPVEDVATILDEPLTSPTAIEHDERLAPFPSLDDYIEWIRLRLRYIGLNPDARQRLKLLWPDDLPVPKHMNHMAHVDRAIPILNIVEANYGLGFVEQPTALQSSGPRQRKGK